MQTKQKAEKELNKIISSALVYQSSSVWRRSLFNYFYVHSCYGHQIGDYFHCFLFHLDRERNTPNIIMWDCFHEIKLIFTGVDRLGDSPFHNKSYSNKQFFVTRIQKKDFTKCDELRLENKHTCLMVDNFYLFSFLTFQR